jgi:hypothetical protein
VRPVFHCFQMHIPLPEGPRDRPRVRLLNGLDGSTIRTPQLTIPILPGPTKLANSFIRSRSATARHLLRHIGP